MSIYYWKGATGVEQVLNLHADVIECLLTGDYNCNDLEKLACHAAYPIYSFRLTEKARLLFTTYKGYLHVLEVLPNHDYQKSRFLKKGVLNRYIDQYKTEHLTFMPLSSDDEKPVFPVEPHLATVQNSEKIGLDWYNQQFICINEQQSEIVQQHHLPLILSGEPGSGKTWVATLMLAQVTHAKKALYLTGEKTLVEKAQENYNGLIIDSDKEINDDNGTIVEFKTYNDLLGERNESFVSISYFEEWLTATQKKKNYLPIETYREFRICSGFNKEQYTRLGQRQSSLSDPQARAQVYDLYQNYLDYLTCQNKIDPCFHPLATEPTYDFIVVDEAQNLSLHQLMLLSTLARGTQILYCLDPNQNMTDVCATRGLLEMLLHDKSVMSATLGQTYRCSQRVVSALNILLEFKRRAIGGKLDKKESATLQSVDNAKIGHFSLLCPLQIDKNWVDSRLGHLAVITTEEKKEEAERLFGTPLIFTPQQIQGQEFHTIVVYKLVPPNINPMLSDASPSKNRAKAGKQDNKLAPLIALWFIAWSRAIDTLVLVEEPLKKQHSLNEALFQPLSLLSSNSILTAGEEQLPDIDWDKIINEQTSLGNTDVAHNIVQYLSGTTFSSYEKIEQRLISSEKTTPKIKTPFDNQLEDNQLEKCLLNLIDKASIRKKFGSIKTHIETPTLDINYTHFNKQSALHLAIKNGHSDIVLLLLARQDLSVNQCDAKGSTALSDAIRLCRVDIVRMLLNDHRIDVNIQGQTSPLLMLSEYLINFQQHKGYGLMMSDLLKNPHLRFGSIFVSNNYAYIRLAHDATYEWFKRLLERNDLNINWINDQGETALIYACKNQQYKIVSLLLECAQILINQKDNDHLTALEYLLEKVITQNISAGQDSLRLLVKMPELDISILYGKNNLRLFLFFIRLADIDLILNWCKKNEEIGPVMVVLEYITDPKVKKDMLEKLLDDNEILAAFIRNTIRDAYTSDRCKEGVYDIFLKNPLLVSLLIIRKAVIFVLITRQGWLGLTEEQYQQLLNDILSSENETKKAYISPYYKILFTPYPNTHSLPFFKGSHITSGEIKNALEYFFREGQRNCRDISGQVGDRCQTTNSMHLK